MLASRLTLVVVAVAAGAYAQLDPRQMTETYKANDAALKDGKGYSADADSSTLGWGEGGLLQGYAAMWEVTADPYWLAKIDDHFRRIMGTASDPDGDGYLSWQTTAYNTAVAFAERLHNVSNAAITPDRQKVMDGKEAKKCTGHTYLIEFPTSAAQYRILDWDTRKPVMESADYKSGAAIEGLVPFRFKIEGETHQGDRFMVRTVAPEPTEFTVHQGMVVYPVALFIEAVKTQPDLQPQFGKDADEFLTFINRNVFEKNERDWLDLGEQGGAYRFEPQITDRYPNRVMPHNQYGALAMAWLVLKDIPGAHPLMGKRAEQMVRLFHNAMHLDEAKNAYRWHYWDWAEYGQPGNSGYEDTSHGTIDVTLAVEAARRGVVFTSDDMVRMANTWLKLMWNGDENNPMMAGNVDGGDPGKCAAARGCWCLLSQWNRQVYDLALKSVLGLPEKQRTAAPWVILQCAKRAGVALTAPAP